PQSSPLFPYTTLFRSKGGRCQPGALLALSLDVPSTFAAHDSHLASLTPPGINLAGQGNPNPLRLAHLSEMLQEGPIGRSRSFLEDRKSTRLNSSHVSI